MALENNAVVLLDKEPGVTSFSALSSFRTAAGRRCGHAGTLDKFASGLLIAFSGRYTRLNDVFMGLDKRYEATVEFGKETDSLDPEGLIVREAEVPSFDAIKNALHPFNGGYLQAPPAYSAVHIDGKRAYQRARNGEEVEIPKRQVIIHSLDIISWEPPFLKIEMKVSKGFYVRSFARDLANECSSAAYLCALRRTSIGPYCVSEAVSSGDLAGIVRKIAEFEPVPFLSRLDGVTRIDVDIQQAERLANGVIPDGLLGEAGENCSIVLFCNDGRLCSVTDRNGRFICQAGTR